MSSTKIQTFGGNVGIGTNDPGSYRLNITGGAASFEDLTVTTSVTVNNVSSAFVPSGLIIMWSGSTIPTGWSLCDGTGTLPDLTDRFIIGSGGTYSQGETGGSITKTLSSANMPGHTHTCTTGSDGGHAHAMTVDTYGTTHTHTTTINQALTGNHTLTINTAGGVHSHSIGSSSHGHTHNAGSAGGGSHGHTQGLIRIFDSANGIDGYGNYPARNHSIARYPGYTNTKAYNSCNTGNHNHSGGVNQGGDHGHSWNATSAAGAHTHGTTFTAGGGHTHTFNTSNSAYHTHAATHSGGGSHSHIAGQTNSTGQGSSFNIIPPYYALAFIMKD